LGRFDHHKIVKDAINFKNQQVSDSSIERFPEDRIEMPIITKDLSILNIVKSFINFDYNNIFRNLFEFFTNFFNNILNKFLTVVIIGVVIYCLLCKIKN